MNAGVQLFVLQLTFKTPMIFLDSNFSAKAYGMVVAPKEDVDVFHPEGPTGREEGVFLAPPVVDHAANFSRYPRMGIIFDVRAFP